MSILIACLLAGLASSQDQKGPEGKILDSGNYDLRLMTPKMAKGKKDVSLPAKVERVKKEFIIHLQGMAGNKITLRGIEDKGKIKVGMTAVERGTLISFHYVGKVETSAKASGVFHCFGDGETLFSGTWVLAKQKE